MPGIRHRHSGHSLQRPAILLAAVVSLAAWTTAACSTDPEGPAAIDVTPLDGGASVSLTSVLADAGRPVVLNVWASWCAPCRIEMPELEAVHRDLGNEVAVIGITDDPDPEAAAALAAEIGVTYPLYVVDTPGGLRHLGITGLPATVFVNSDATIVDTHAGALDAAGIIERIPRHDGLD